MGMEMKLLGEKQGDVMIEGDKVDGIGTKAGRERRNRMKEKVVIGELVAEKEEVVKMGMKGG
jgi:hypothetical protein